MPAIVPASQRPWSTPKTTDEIRNDGQVNRPGATEATSAEIRRRGREPRKASSSASGTVTTEPTTRNATEAAASQRGSRRSEPATSAEAAAVAPAWVGSSASQRAKTATPPPAAGHDQRPRRSTAPYARRHAH